MSLPNGPSEAMPYFPTLKAIAPNAPMGANFMGMPTILNTTWVRESTRFSIGLARGPAADKANPHNSATNRTSRTSPLANASTVVLGMMCSRKSVELWLSSDRLGRNFMRVQGSRVGVEAPPGLHEISHHHPTTSARVEIVSQYNRALPPARPTLRMSSMPAMPDTTVQKITSVITIAISRMKASRAALDGKKVKSCSGC